MIHTRWCEKRLSCRYRLHFYDSHFEMLTFRCCVARLIFSGWMACVPSFSNKCHLHFSSCPFIEIPHWKGLAGASWSCFNRDTSASSQRRGRERELDKERTSNAGHFLLVAERIGVDLESRQRALLQRGTNFEIQFVRIGIFSEASQQALQLGAEAIRRKR